MKREILCSDCNKETSVIKLEDLLITTEDVEKAGGVIELPLPIPEEIKKKGGIAFRTLRCDLCNRIIEKGEYCIARSIIGYRQIYTPWESDYIEVM